MVTVHVDARLQLQVTAEAPVNHGHILLSFNAINVVYFRWKKIQKVQK